MRKFILVLFALFLPTFLLSYDVSFNKKFSKSITPDLLTTYVNVTVENKDEFFINKEIEKFNSYIKNNDDIKKKNGSYTLSPRYKWVKNEQRFLGYAGNLRYTIESKNAKKLNVFIARLIEIKKTSAKGVKLNISNISWKISKDLHSNNLDSLRIEAITWAETYANSLSTTLSKDCQIKQVNINSASNNYPRTYMAMEAAPMAKSISNVTPVNSSKEISINPNFVMECK